MLIDREKYTKTLCMSELHAVRTRLAQTHYFDAMDGAAYAGIVWACRGSATVHTHGRTYEFAEGSLFYIPEGLQFSAVWSGTPGIEFYSFHIYNHKLDLKNTARYALQRVDAMSIPETGARVEEIFRFFAGDRVSRVRAVGLYYGFYADILPHLQAEPTVNHHPALLEAIAHIESHYTEHFDVGRLAAAVCLSESRLHHLFKNELGTTPGRYHNQLRIERAAAALRSGDRTVADIAAENGFNSSAYFREQFKAMTGMTPAEYRTMARHGEQNEEG